MTQSEEIKQKIRDLFGDEDQIELGKVLEVDEELFTCKVELDEDIIIENVRLRSIVDGEKQGFCFIPKIESLVLVNKLGESNELFVSKFSEVDKLVGSSGEWRFNFDQEKVELAWSDDATTKMTMLEKSVEILSGERKIFVDGENGKIVMNDKAVGSYMTDINKLVDKIKALEEQLNDLKQVFTKWVPAPMDGGAVLKTGITQWAGGIIKPLTNVDDLKDETICH